MILLDSFFEVVGAIIIIIIGSAMGLISLYLLKTVLSKLFNIRFVNRSGMVLSEPEDFDNLKEIVSDIGSSVKTSIQKEKLKRDPEQINSNIIIPKMGVGGLFISNPIHKIIKQLGNDYEIIEHGDYSIEYFYPVYGISFYIKYGDIRKRVFSIKLTENCKAVTKNNIYVGCKLHEVIEKYGEAKFTTSMTSNIFSAGYEGIAFSFDTIQNVPKFPFNYELHKNAIIKIISINK